MALSCVKELAGFDLDSAGAQYMYVQAPAGEIFTVRVSAPPLVKVMAVRAPRCRVYVGGSFRTQHPLGVVVNRPSVWPGR